MTKAGDKLIAAAREARDMARGATLIERVKEALAGSTPGPWEWWTSNSYKRLKVGPGTRHGDNVLEGIVCKDGMADLVVSDDDMALIALAPEMAEALVAAEDLARAVQSTGYAIDGYGVTRLLDPYGMVSINKALSRFRAATEGK